MPRYTSGDPVKSGVPLGGIGCGKVEILPNGLLDNITFLNNWERPLTHSGSAAAGHALGLPGFHFGFWMEGEGAWLLQTQPMGVLPIVKRIEYEGTYPVARLIYELPTTVQLTAWNPTLPADESASGLPAAIFSFHVRNTTTRPISIAFLGTLRNIVGEWPTGRFNSLRTSKTLTSLVAGQKKSKAGDPSAGELALSVPNTAGDVTSLLAWNLQKIDFQFDFDTIDLGPAWDAFARDGALKDTVNDTSVHGGGIELGGALAVKRKLQPDEEAVIPFYLTWFFPHHLIGHHYAHQNKGSVEVAAQIDKKQNALLQRTAGWHAEIQRWNGPDWLKDALINNLYVLSSGSWWGKKGEFSIYEAPVICPLMSTLDVRFWGSLPLALFFPKLEKTELLQFKDAQRPDGYVPHDLGKSRLDAPSDGTTRYRWKDLPAQFILLAYRDYLWTQDTSFLKTIFPSCRQAMAWLQATDRNGDGLPDHEGADQTFDVWPMSGTGAYVGGLYLAALKALAQMAELRKDTATARACEERFLPAQAALEAQLWNGRYFVAWRDGERVNEACTIAQLTGPWIAHLLKLGPLLDHEKTWQALQSVIELNEGNTPFGATNAVFPNQKRDISNLHSRTIWVGMCYMLSALAIYEGKPAEGLRVAEKVWRTMTDTVKNAWNQPDILDPDTGAYGFGDVYQRNMGIWAIPLAMGLVTSKGDRPPQ